LLHVISGFSKLLKLKADEVLAKDRFRASGFREQYIGNAGEYLWLLTSAVTFVLLIACVNVTSLMLTAALGREKEMAIRAALGAARGRLIRLILTESLLLNFIGGAFGLALSVVCVELLAGLLRFDMPVWMKIAIDARALLFTMAVSILTGVAAGVAPAVPPKNLIPR
jgi:putative ABC transport system permease protein